jgi:hypothetical protein
MAAEPPRIAWSKPQVAGSDAIREPDDRPQRSGDAASVRRARSANCTNLPMPSVTVICAVALVFLKQAM